MRFNNCDEVKKKYNVGGNWMTLVEGENKIRIVSEFIDYGEHWDEEKQRSIVCVGKENCIYCQNGEKPTVKFLGWVIDRDDENKVKTIRIGYKIFEELGAIAKNKDYQFDVLPPFDVTITKEGQKLKTKYKVIADRKDSKLTAKEIEETKDLKDLQEVIDAMKEKELNPESEE